MELTQRIGCTQILNGSQTESISPEQVAFLGICGQKYPVIRGPNKIGRDPDTCNIVLKLNSISRHHAVINVLNSSEYMLMDLNSANKTKLENKTLVPYIPYPLRNGDVVQLGEIFGIFTLLHENNDLPLTQAVEIPDTPIATRHISKFNNAHITTVPESPDVSDKDDSFIMPSQPKMRENMKNHNNICKSSGKTLSAPQNIGTKKIDNAYWNSSRKSESLNLQSNTTIGSLNSSLTSLKSSESKLTTNNIHELNTQIPNDLVNNQSSDSLFIAETQITENRQSLNIYNMETQVPVGENLPAVCKIQDQQNVAFDFFTGNKENDIFEAETQAFIVDKPSMHIVKKDDKIESKFKKNSSNTSEDTSDDIIIFDEMESQPIVEVFESQPLLLPEEDVVDKDNLLLSKNKYVTEKGTKRNVRLKSDSSTDCEDGSDDIIRLSQNVFGKGSDDDVTDCEDVPECQEGIKKPDADDDLTDCEDDLFEKNNLKCDSKAKSDTVEESKNFEDLPTQIIQEDQSSLINKDENDIKYEDILTQVIDKVDVHHSNLKTDPNIEDMLTQVVVQNENKPVQFQTNTCVTPFKVPQSPVKTKKENKNLSKLQLPVVFKSKIDDDFHYASTQEVFDDLCSQREINSVIPTSENNKVSFDNKSSRDLNEKTYEYNSSNQIQNLNVLDVTKLRKIGSDSSSDVENTPKKRPPLTFMETDLPNSQEIKSSVTLNTRNNMIELSSESETENDSEQCTPILFHHKKKKCTDVKINLSNKFEIDALPTRIITRVRKPALKVLNNADISKKITNNILKPKFLTEQEENIDKEIITENISRLKSKAAKPLTKEKSTKIDETNIDKKGRSRKEKKERRKEKKEAEEKTNKKSKEKNIEKNSKSSKDALNTIEGYLNNTTLDKSESSSITTRSGTRKKADTDKKSTSPEIVKSKSNKSDHKHIHKNDITELISDQTIRRSRRQKNKYDVAGQGNLKQNEESTVYSESGLDSPNIMKRSADFQFPSAKKAKTSHGGNTSSASKYTIDTQYVLFTAFPNEKAKKKLETLGAVIVNDIMSCTMVLTLQIKRTFKLLCAVGLGRPIVGPAWVEACADANCIVDPHQYILKDEKTEQRFQFDLQRTLRGRRNFLKGYNVSCTPKVLPNAQEMKMIVECSGGTWKEGGKSWLCVSCTADKSLWPQFRRKGATVVSTELILAGVLRQKLDIQNNKLA